MSISNFRINCRALGLCLVLVCAFGIHPAASAALDLPGALSQLPTASFEDKSTIIHGLGQSASEGSSGAAAGHAGRPRGGTR